MYLAIGAKFSYPADKRQRLDQARRHIVEPGDKGVVGHITDQFHASGPQRLRPSRLYMAFELNEKEA
jgi:hypothetical protein